MPKIIVIFVSKDHDALLDKYCELSRGKGKHHYRPENFGPQNEVDLAKKIALDDSEIQHTVYTMYPNFLNRVGCYIADGAIDNRNVFVFIVGDSSFDYETEVATFDEEGFLTNWPYGYLEPDFD